MYIGLDPNILGPDPHVARPFNDLHHQSCRHVEAKKFRRDFVTDQLIIQLGGGAVVSVVVVAAAILIRGINFTHGQSRLTNQFINDGSQTDVIGFTEHFL